ncbi:hypothetical protein EU556_19045 [Hymenobacter fodinae]|uniref:Uncharacterized protein n=1 Tax=Hymenobacter fodinae TaxID=2510796 RepID=A0A4Z0P3C1_9BACT|nr:hypothetical protein EU556_19045 [Hymenobacter fodinae]
MKIPGLLQPSSKDSGPSNAKIFLAVDSLIFQLSRNKPNKNTKTVLGKHNRCFSTVTGNYLNTSFLRKGKLQSIDATLYVLQERGGLVEASRFVRLTNQENK